MNLQKVSDAESKDIQGNIKTDDFLVHLLRKGTPWSHDSVITRPKTGEIINVFSQPKKSVVLTVTRKGASSFMQLTNPQGANIIGPNSLLLDPVKFEEMFADMVRIFDLQNALANPANTKIA